MVTLLKDRCRFVSGAYHEFNEGIAGYFPKTGEGDVQQGGPPVSQCSVAKSKASGYETVYCKMPKNMKHLLKGQ